ncbi:MAG: TrkH family potassium uptake protein, partial [Clostridia bacterium]|nr:TrkH family potassium uptake protein [Clostridia bacterium]
MFLPVAVGLIYREKQIVSFLITIGIVAAVGAILYKRKPKKNNLYSKEGYMIVGLAWLLMSAFGALPMFISGSVSNYIDAFFETVSGFTTTGSTILSDIESLPRCILFWRSFTHFIGGMGILVFVLAVIPRSEGSSIHIMKAEVPGPVVGKLVSKVTVTARILYGIYIGMTVLLIILLKIVGLPLFDSVISAFGT